MTPAKLKKMVEEADKGEQPARPRRLSHLPVHWSP